MFKIVAKRMLNCRDIGTVVSFYDAFNGLILWETDMLETINLSDIPLGLDRTDFVPEVAVRVWRV